MARIDFKAYTLPLKVAYRYAKGVYQQRSGVFVRAEIGGHIGWGEVAPPLFVPVDSPSYVRQAEDLIQALDLTDDTFLRKLDDRNPQSPMRCGISTAWLSMRAAAEGISLSRYLGAGEREPAKYVPINGLVGDNTVEGAVEQARECIEAGMKTIKIKCFADFDRDLVRVRAIRQSFPGAIFRLDPNESWTEDVALDHLKKMAPFGIEYVEDALPLDLPLKVYADLRAKSPIKLAWDAPACSLKAVQDLIEAEAADVIILKLLRVGGPDRLYQVIKLGEQRGVQCTVTSGLETAIGVTAALHCASLLPAPIPDCGLGISHFLERDVASVPPVESGRRRVPTAPGLGLDNVTL